MQLPNVSAELKGRAAKEREALRAKAPAKPAR
jgi:hypothetical protein